MGMFERIERVSLPVRDASAAAEWYVRKLGFAVAGGEAGTGEAVLKVGDGETLLSLVERHPHRPLPHISKEGHTPHFNLFTPNANLRLADLRARGIRLTETVESPVLKCCEMYDVDDNVVGICYEKPTSRYFVPSAELLPPLFTKVLAVFIPAVDLERAIRWYVGTLGFTLVHHWGGGADLRIGDGETIATLIEIEPAAIGRLDLSTGEPFSYFTLKAADLEQAKARLEREGAETSPIRRSGPTCRFDVQDPEGWRIGVEEGRLPVFGR
ncbi:VOC family protein [Paenibacillus flagellatus]|uniref:VOC domain-containing protein n=1 Tax=Paenibacillus flagellatus TaxID=2211139 RepID=A0A2V5K8C5_9BACL|nr:VOC family protein [Paenibacillus flagellatus]PYI55112.1 hypothetical protein DLM86_11325 [Paenibacillus flagellatus]